MKKHFKELFKDTSIYGFTKVLSRLVSFFLLPLYTIYLSPKDYGILAMTEILLLLYGTLGALGLKSSIMRFINTKSQEDAEQEVYTTGFICVLFNSLFIGALLFLFSGLISKYLLDDVMLRHLINITILSGLISINSGIPQAYLRIKRRITALAITSLINLFFSIGITIILITQFNWGVLGAIAGSTAGNLVSFLYLLSIVYLPRLTNFQFQQLKKMLWYSLPFVPHYLQAALLAIIAQFLIKEMMSLEQAGLYNIAWKFCLPMVMIIDAFQTSWGAYKFEIRNSSPNPKEVFRQVVNVYTIGISLLFFLGILFLADIIKLLITDSFHNAANYVSFLLLIPLARGMYYMLTTGIAFSERPKYLPLISFAGLITSSILLLCLIPLFEVPGAGMAMAGGWAMMAFLGLIYAQKIFSINYDIGFILLLLLSNILLLLLLPFLHPMPFLLKLFISTLGTLACALLAVKISSTFSFVEKQMKKLKFK